MANILKHKFVSGKSDPPDNTLVRPSNWNEEHVFAGGAANNKLVWSNGASDKVSWVEEVYDVSAPPYSADMTGASSGRAALQSAINDAQTSLTSKKKVVYIPEGTLLLDSEITFKEHNGFARYPITLRGARGNREGAGTIIKASPSFSSPQIFRFIENGGGSLNAFYNLENFYINGNSVANLNAFDMETMSYAEFSYISAVNVLGKVFKVGQCEVLIFSYCHFSGNNDVLYFHSDVAHNAIRVYCNEFSSNSGWAIFSQRGTGFSVHNNTFQLNYKGALYYAKMSSFSIYDNHFEENGTTTGHSYLTPATGLIKADIHLNGDDNLDNTILDPDFMCESGVIRTNVFSSASPTYHIFGNALANVKINNNLVAPNQKLIGTWGSKTYSFIKNVKLIDNDNIENSASDIGETESKQILNIAATFGVDNFANPHTLHTIDSDLPPINLLDQFTMNTWGQLVTLSAGTFQRVAGGSFTFRIAGTGPTHVFGATIPIGEIPSVIGKWLWFGCWGSLSTVTNNNLAFYVTFTGATGIGYSNQSNSGDTVVGRFRSVGFLVPSGTTEIKVGVQQFGSGGGVVDIWHPILTYVGVPYYKIRENLTKQWPGIAAPSAGAWNRGDMILKTNPSAGGEPGYVCVTAGSPGTWKNMANLAA